VRLRVTFVREWGSSFPESNLVRSRSSAKPESGFDSAWGSRISDRPIPHRPQRGNNAVDSREATPVTRCRNNSRNRLDPAKLIKHHPVLDDWIRIRTASSRGLESVKDLSRIRIRIATSSRCRYFRVVPRNRRIPRVLDSFPLNIGRSIFHRIVRPQIFADYSRPLYR